MRAILLTVCSAILLTSLNGCAPTHEPARPAPASRPATPDGRITVRIATAADLRLSLVTRIDATDHFPICTLKLYNNTAEPIVVGYSPECVTAHCGPFEVIGPSITFVHRREILDPQQALELELPTKVWTLNAPDGERQLMIPTTLAAGVYDTWATFQLESAPPTTLTSKHDHFTVR